MSGHQGLPVGPSVRAPSVNAAEREALDLLRRALNAHARAVSEVKAAERLGVGVSHDSLRRRRAALLAAANKLADARRGLDALLLEDA